jgi:hypothetical protein
MVYNTTQCQRMEHYWFFYIYWTYNWRVCISDLEQIAPPELRKSWWKA